MAEERGGYRPRPCDGQGREPVSPKRTTGPHRGMSPSPVEGHWSWHLRESSPTPEGPTLRNERRRVSRSPVHWAFWRPLEAEPPSPEDPTVPGWSTLPMGRCPTSRSPARQVRMGRDQTGSTHDRLLGRRTPLGEREGPPRRQCCLPACGREVVDERQHAIDYHLPPNFYHWSPGAVSGALATLANAVLGHHGGVPGLLRVVRRPHFVPGCIRITPAEEEFLQELSSHWGEEPTQAPSLYPPSAASMIAHWAVLMQLLFRAGAQVQRNFREFSEEDAPAESGTLKSRIPMAGAPPITKRDAPRSHSETSSGSRSVNFPQNRSGPRSPVRSIAEETERRVREGFTSEEWRNFTRHQKKKRFTRARRVLGLPRIVG